MAATFVIFLREGVEASMIVAILLAYLNRSGQRRHFRDVFAGVAAALVLAGAGGLTYMTFWMPSHARGLKGELQSRADAVLASHGENAAAPRAGAAVRQAVRVPDTGLTAGTAGSAAGASLAAREPAADAEMSRGARVGVALLAFQAVGREGVEPGVFTLAIAFSSSQRGGLLAGAAAGLAIALAIAFVMYRLGHRINVGRFFMIVGALLM